VQVVGEELRILISTVEDLIERLGTAADPELKRLRKQAEVATSNAKDAIGEGGAQVRDQLRSLAGQGEEYVRRRPLASLGLMALGMLAIGLLTSRSMMSD
jgi:ElaB/YqjD/DUF883 family membrane-anchored ribosome-binding protein